ncbi:MAG: RagB/SusD family nutrient uptake outer membrane protein [Bacteroidales bacterium]|nr:RagB/SusD family nutrient uptake outer membrane protein [Candidatus Cryptobacteroides aphodequi]
MKKSIAIIFAAAALAASCTNLDEEIFSQVPKDVFLSDDNLLALYTSRPYTALQSWGAEQSMLTLIMQVSNEVAIPVSYNGSWGEPRYGELQRHDFPTSNKLIRCGWDYCFDGISACNDAIYELENISNPTDASRKSVAEIKVLRAFYYLLAVDCFGNVPYAVDKKQTGYPEQKDRAFMLAFLEKEVKDNIALLDETVNASTYGRVTKGMANFILAKIYLNSEKWTGTARYSEAAAVCKEIMDSGQYSLAPSYAQNFAIQNENGPEAIFAIPYSSVYTPQGFYIFVMTFNDDLQTAFQIGETWNGSMICQPDFFDSYESGDLRKDATWLYGQVYDYSGQKYQLRIIKDGETTYQDYILTGSPIEEEKYAKGIARMDGARIVKWPYQSDGTLKSYKVCMENDFYLMRYSDVVLMYVEALVRQDKAGEAAAVAEFKAIRERAGLAPMSAADLTLDNLLLERQHELALEGWSRQDLIRFGKYTDAWWCKEAGDAHIELFPIPDERMGDNPNLTQNPGY